MLLNFQQAQLNIGKTLPLDIQVQLDDSIVIDKDYKFTKPAILKGSMCYEFECLKVQCVAQVSFMAVCDACGESFKKTISFDVNETFAKVADEFNNYYELSSNTVDISRPLIDHFLVNLPSKMLCKQDCKGLCKHCGKNLNFQQCNCEEMMKELENQNNPFYKLKNLDRKK